MRASHHQHSGLSSLHPNLPFCHRHLFQLALNSHFLSLTRPRQHPDSRQKLCVRQIVRKPIDREPTRPSISASMADEGSQVKPFSVLFVCLGNICRSPAAEGVFRDLVRKRGLDSKFNIDSAGTIGYHEGNPADSRMRAASHKRGIAVTSISRPIRASDFRDFDLILAMDKQNKEDILEAFERWRFRDTLPADGHKKVKLMCSYCKQHRETEVPDPYYGGPQGFEKVLDILEDACESLLNSILDENSQLLE
ncbi:hypothetical protein QQ045_027143 [Rhodiola kirilowii]